jgi:lipopolysaccharide export LptBFGC system permease protein LptF
MSLRWHFPWRQRSGPRWQQTALPATMSSPSCEELARPSRESSSRLWRWGSSSLWPGSTLPTSSNPSPQRRKQLASQATPQQGAFEQGQTVRGGKDGEWLIQFQEGARTTETTWKLFNVSLIQKERVLLAKEATYSANSGQWSLKNATEHRYDSAGRLLSELQRPTWPEPIVARTDFSSSLPFWELQQSFQTPLRFDQLGAKAQAAAKNGNKKQALEYETARWFKLALSSMCFVFALCAPPLSFKFSKAGSFSGVLLSVIIVFIGWNTVLFMKSVALSGWVPPVLCAFSTHVLFLLAGLWLLFRAD